MLRLPAAPSYRRELWRQSADDTARVMSMSAVVFAPHQDDETLGCGGTMALKARAGAELSCVFMTDGTTSHRTLMDAGELHRLRTAEALEATAILGLAPEQVGFLDFADSALGEHEGEATERVVEILRTAAPQEVYVPYRRDGTADHEATYRIVLAALARVGKPVQILEYPVWFWNQWPWVSLDVGMGRQTLTTIRRVAGSRFGRELLEHFRTSVRVGPVLPQKRAALACHRSQTTRLRGGASWPVLGDVSRGEFLGCFFQEFEVFRRTAFHG